jgi:hypothetical protein
MPLWTLGLAVVVLGVGTLGLDLWDVLAARQELAAIADAVAYAGASGIDEERLRRDGEVVLDEEHVRSLAARALAAQDLPDGWRGMQLAVGDGVVTVSVDGRIDGFLLPLLGFEALDVTLSSSARPVLR